MALTKKVSPAEAGRAGTEYPDQMPRIPETVLERFPEMRQWQGQLDSWWFDVRTVHQREIKGLQDQINANTNKITGIAG